MERFCKYYLSLSPKEEPSNEKIVWKQIIKGLRRDTTTHTKEGLCFVIDIPCNINIKNREIQELVKSVRERVIFGNDRVHNTEISDFIKVVLGKTIPGEISINELPLRPHQFDLIMSHPISYKVCVKPSKEKSDESK